MAIPQWREFEVLVAKIQKELAADSLVTHDDKIMGRKSKRMRQIDVSIRSKIGQFDVLIIIDCKDYAEPVDVKAVEEFIGLVDDVGAQQAAIVAAKGFTETAKTRAIEAGLGVYTVVDTDPHKWQVHVFMPVVCDFRRAIYSLRLEFSQPKPFRCPCDHNEWILFDANESMLGPVPRLFAAKWNVGDLPTEEGEYEDLDFLGQPVLMDNGYGELLPITITANVLVEKRLYFGKLSIKQISGFKDEKNGMVISRGFTTGPLDVETIEKEWQRIKSEDELTVRPIMAITALDCHPE